MGASSHINVHENTDDENTTVHLDISSREFRASAAAARRQADA
jgi:hypothetical protein